MTTQLFGTQAMHAEAYDWVRRYAGAPATVLDIGGRDVNGSCRPLFPDADYLVLDLRLGVNVDIVADAATWTPHRSFALVVCTEVFEHTALWREICATAYKACAPGGRFIATMAGPGRPPHSAVDGGWTLHEGEHYANIDPAELVAVLTACGWQDVLTDVRDSPADVRCVARKGEEP